MFQLALNYFDIDGGRAEPVRLALHIGGITFEDRRFAFSEFAEQRKTTPLNKVPTLFVNDEQITQCNAMLRFAGKLANLYPTEPLPALHCDEILDAVEDATHDIVSTFGLSDDALITARANLVSGSLTRYLTWAEARLTQHGGEFFADQRLTVADLKMAVLIKWLSSGKLEHVPADLVTNVAPKLQQQVERIYQLPKISSYYAQSH